MSKYPYDFNRRQQAPPVPNTHPLYRCISNIHDSFFALCKTHDAKDTLSIIWERGDNVVSLLFDKRRHTTQMLINLDETINIILAPTSDAVRDYLTQWRRYN